MSVMYTIDHYRTPDFPYDIACIFPAELYNDKIFNNNLAKTHSTIKEIIKEHEMLQGNKRVYQSLRFDIQKQKQMEAIKKSERKISELMDEINENISPYYWVIHKDIDTYWFEAERWIKADYVLVLRGGEDED